MEKGDILTVAGGLVLVLILALIVNPQTITGFTSPVAGRTSLPTTEPLPLPTIQKSIPTTTVQSPIITTVSPNMPSRPVRILYTNKPFTYPVVKLPDRLDIYGESDIRRPGQDTVTFAYLEESRGGLSQVFTVPYPVWTMDIRVIDNVTPSVANFRMALCYAANGTVIDGVELNHPGMTYKKIQTSNTPLYLIISMTDIQGSRIDLQTSREYFEQSEAQKKEILIQQ
ncbi:MULTISPECIES: hypothetical protein [unclassified Methanoregula]|uniref:hypothetical protein n=1 Tax=unclassified Methanoregula TaxID=2649730 RepID=UPI0009D39B7B|nr:MULTISPECIES: hypothetical protein [unclassified Methanoregula]OPX65221.1 MAG: hypothetical protein A4E33_00253 [Methanoregula sp. PtaB.Bin085]OPY32130.1 MAG: hypothetical protein A4E34_02503 [Methanoregula sp. PtaU1.Bin006]